MKLHVHVQHKCNQRDLGKVNTGAPASSTVNNIVLRVCFPMLLCRNHHHALHFLTVCSKIHSCLIMSFENNELKKIENLRGFFLMPLIYSIYRTSLTF